MQELPKPIQLVKERLNLLYRDSMAEAIKAVKSGNKPKTGTLCSLSLEELQQAKLHADELFNSL